MKTCTLVIGHKQDSPGATNKNSGLSEFAFNSRLALAIADRAAEERCGVELLRVMRRSYGALPYEINALNPDIIISLHCNAFNTRASGTRVLYYHKSKKGRQLAEILQEKLMAALGLRDRGITPKTVEDRGGYLLFYTRAPAVIAEPFFIDNDDDLERVMDVRDKLIMAYVEAIGNECF